MYSHTNPTFPRADVVLGDHSSSPDSTAASAFMSVSGQFPSHLIIPDHLAGVEVGSTTTSGYSSYGSPSSLTSGGTTTQQPSLIQRSISSHSLEKNGYHCHFACPQDFLVLDTSPVRRVFSTGDLQHEHKADSPLSSESRAIIESMSKTCKYSPEEKKERIEKYKSKRTQRNFKKKIKYACRKTLADSRPRIRGRFASNGEMEKNRQPQWSNVSGEEDEDYDDNWIDILDAFSANSIP
ncbi:hypothetical protein P3X46_000282 [Hevea brasiliensis]|uniref:CCT domain-containing protein n=1 Tax=Hevea brasiliensis TaxID=3981 RepID=A0ABQ9N8S4_HEVBR|nr:uncharacterized protein LOC110665393 [Hevea brasiliensis]KAJ9188932.1 hypothetical protein P3X46_000282 [Hevea brasiliensis]